MPGPAQMRRRPPAARGGANRTQRRLDETSDYAYQGGDAVARREGGSSCWQTFFKVVSVVVFAPPLLNYATLMREKQLLHPENHTLYDIGLGQKMFMTCMGHGSPTVIVDGPAGYNSDICLPLQEELSSLARVCIFDRAGVGFSDPMPFFNHSDPVERAMAGPTEHTSRRTVQDLRRLITRAIPHADDLVLIGSQLGSLNMAQYAHSFPQGVSQVVLLDPPHTSLFADEGWTTYVTEYLGPYTRMVQLLAVVGFNRLGILLGAVKFPPPCTTPTRHSASSDQQFQTPPEDSSSTMKTACIRSQHFLTDPSHIGAGAAEIYRMEASAAQLFEAVADSPFKVPTAVITGNYYDETLPMNLNRAWAKAAQDTITALSAQQVIVNDADTKMLFTKPNDLLYAIKKIVKRVKKNQRVASS